MLDCIPRFAMKPEPSMTIFVFKIPLFSNDLVNLRAMSQFTLVLARVPTLYNLQMTIPLLVFTL